MKPFSVLLLQRDTLLICSCKAKYLTIDSVCAAWKRIWNPPLADFMSSITSIILRICFGRSQLHSKILSQCGQSTGSYCGVLLDSRDLYLRIAGWTYQSWKTRSTKILVQTCTHSNGTSTTDLRTGLSPRNPTKQLAGNFMLVDVSLRQLGKDGKSGMIDFSIVTPAAESYCTEKAKTPLYAANLRMKAKRLCWSY